jgi:hypothetical protein
VRKKCHVLFEWPLFKTNFRFFLKESVIIMFTWSALNFAFSVFLLFRFRFRWSRICVSGSSDLFRWPSRSWSSRRCRWKRSKIRDRSLFYRRSNFDRRSIVDRRTIVGHCRSWDESRRSFDAPIELISPSLLAVSRSRKLIDLKVKFNTAMF